MQVATQRLSDAQRNATVITTDKKQIAIGDLVGHGPTMLAFFPAAFTGVCTAEMCTFRDNMARFNNAKASVYGISIDTPFTLDVFARENGLTFPLLSDANREAIRAFDVVWPDLHGVHETSKRAVFVIDNDGAVTYSWIGAAPGDEPPYDEVMTAVVQAA